MNANCCDGEGYENDRAVADEKNKANVRQDKLGKGGRSWIVHERKPLFLMPRGFDSLAVKAHHQP